MEFSYNESTWKYIIELTSWRIVKLKAGLKKQLRKNHPQHSTVNISSTYNITQKKLVSQNISFIYLYSAFKYP